jgi:hypothetical protein
MPLKARAEDIRRLTDELQEKGIVNLERPARELLTLEGLANLPGLKIDDPNTTLGWYVLGGSSYVVVCE